MVRPKGPKIFAGLLAVGIIGGAAWWFTRPAGPVGAAEDPRKILVVGGDEGTATTLTDLGFDARQGTFDDLAAEGSKEGASGEGLEAIVHLADMKGYGYVAVHEPLSHGSPLQLTGDSDDITKETEWAVFTVGELGKPPRATVDPNASEIEYPDYAVILRAGFIQEKLASTLFAESRLPIDAVELHNSIKAAVDLHGAYAMLDRKSLKELRARTERLVDDEQQKPAAAVLAGPLESTEAYALADGTTLAVTAGVRLVDGWDPDVHFEATAGLELWYLPPGQTDLSERKRCKSLRGGTLTDGRNSYQLNAAGNVMMVDSGPNVELWILDESKGACEFTRKGKIPALAGPEHSWGSVGPDHRVLRPASNDEALWVNVHSVDGDAPVDIQMPGCSFIGDPEWLDDKHFAISCRWDPPEIEEPEYDPYSDDFGLAEEDPEAEGTEAQAEPPPPPPPPPEQAWVYVVRIEDQRIVAIPGTLIDDEPTAYNLRSVPGSKTIDLLAVHGLSESVVRVQSSQDVASLFSAAEPTFAKLAEADAAALAAEAAAKAAAEAGVEAQAPTPAAAPPTDGAEVDPTQQAPEEPLLRPAFVPWGNAVAALSADQFTSKSLDFEGATSFALSPQGTHVVYVSGNASHTLEVMALADGAKTTVSNNPEADHSSPRFTSDGKGLSFNSRYPGPNGSDEVGRLATLP
ncbi:MAG: hypothetical protein AAF799_14940 [Myxococcota bacterium]